MRRDRLERLVAALDPPAPLVLTACALRLAGVDADTVRRAIATSWQVPVRGIYVPHRMPLTDRELAEVARAHAGPDAVVSGLLAARALGLRWLPDGVPGVVALILPDQRRRSTEGLVLVRRCAALQDMSPQLWQGVPLAPTAQVVIDSCRQNLAFRKSSVSPRSAKEKGGWFERSCLRDIRGIVLGAIADKRCATEEIQHLLETGPVRDSALIRRACRDAERGAASPPEAELVDGLIECGIAFACNVEVWDGDVLVAVLDVHLIGTGVGAEMDSKEAHEREDLLDATLQRHDRMEGRGMKLCHVTPTRYRSDPARFHEKLFTAARERLAQGLGDPPGLRFVLRGSVIQGGRPGAPPYRLPAVSRPEAA